MLEWDDRYSIANEAIDTQHKFLFELVNRCSTKNIEQLNRATFELYKYTRVHFRDEEAYMKSIHYPKFDSHQNLHIDLITQLNNIANKKFNSDMDIDAFVTFTENWLINHIIKHDMDIRIFSQQRKP